LNLAAGVKPGGLFSAQQPERVTMPKKPTEPRTADLLGDRQQAADVDAWLYKYAETFWRNYVNFREHAKNDDNKFYHAMRDYYGSGVSVVGFLRAQLKSSKGVFNHGSTKAIRCSRQVSDKGDSSLNGSENPETD
jgi:hypothetical protein